ncbi:hypothetical protein [Sedimentitalea todarodis]|uniref:DUF3052 domain-containing protein n=1 Tax=Sedimentitalea todarodis TaxID=1631240 RepID=A0ABU3VIA5_9RHOB|nr:hypothetical protein [Sedimentitalea todarodis]MDU9005889.1 hypothetical protein [Sedimentitalea todarodis]
MNSASNAGYSGTPLIRKLGFKPGWCVRVLHAPEGYEGLLAADPSVKLDHSGGQAVYDAVHLFLRNTDGIATATERGIALLKPGGMIWLSWAKKSSTLHAGVTEDDLRAAVLPLGWVDVKVCAVDADWSGLKFLKRRG